jgi:membrane-associated PAP2 superfamily phosphatase
MPNSRFWVLHAWLPAALFVAALAAITAFDLDRRIADALFFDRAAGTWVGADSWWAVDLIHTGGALFVRLVGLAALAVWVASYFTARLRGVRLRAGYVVLALILCTSVVGGLKQVTRVDCPRDLAGYGGVRPYAPLLADRAADLPKGRCYPGSHASSGFALMAFYFALRNRRGRLAGALLAAAIGIGVVFSVGQQARGAHFLSHDLTSAAIAWFLLLTLWQRLLESPAPDVSRWISTAPCVQTLDGTPPRGPGLVGRPSAHPAHARGRRAGLRDVLQRLFPARLPVRPAAPEWRRRGDARRGAGDPRQGHAQDG